MSGREFARATETGDGREAGGGPGCSGHEGAAPDAIDRARGLGVRLLDLALRVPFAIRVLAPFGVMTLLWLSSSRQPGGQTASVIWSFLHNSAHVVAFFALGGAWLLALLRRDHAAAAPATRVERVRPATFIAALTLAIGYGIGDELHQSYVPGRDCSFYDVISDACGAVLATLFVLWLVRGDKRALAGLLLTSVAALAGVAAATFL